MSSSDDNDLAGFAATTIPRYQNEPWYVSGMSTHNVSFSM